ncbi:bifunctional diguanylate cyclase/phosphodiesterase [Azospirillum soli]|uniref:bifunctional diguanylate cyclase/phosphodiesterase n=1 Tax=Azospirillum soli TaxID=1304799 RepID=UPI001AEAF831|nr:EAL domain-containing protein [Azospirillum soli]MBP2314947.1 diguanylate cyclase (GGDEF)-like protein/PAS domain S-box-containing protein [Azospirillum soli]
MRKQTVTSHANAGRRRRPLLYAAVALAVLAGFCAVLGIELIRSHASEQAYARRHAENLVLALEGHVRATVRRIDQVLLETQYRLQERFPDGLPSGTVATDLFAEVNADLARMLAYIPESQSLRVADAKGIFVFDASSVPPPATISDRRYFLANQGYPKAGLVISEPIFARATSNWVITLSRRLEDRDGNFAGLVQGAVNAQFFEEFFKTLNTGEQGSITIADADLHLIARHPALPDRFGERINNQVLANELREHESGSTVARSFLDGETRIYGYQRVKDLPFVILAGLSYDDAMAGWYRKAVSYGLFATMLAAALLALILVWQRSHSRAIEIAQDMTAAYADTAARMRALLDSIPDLAWIRGTDLRFIAANEAYATQFALGVDDIIGKPVQDSWANGGAAMFHAEDAAVLNGVPEIRSEVETRDPLGRRLVLEVIRVPVKDADGAITGIAGVARDITSRTEAEEQRSENQAMFQAMFEADSAIKLILDPEDGGRVIHANPAAVIFYGYAPSDLLAMTLGDIEARGDAQKEPPPNRAFKGTRIVAHRLGSGKIRQLEVHYSPLRLSGRNLVYAILYDVTEREREAARQRLAASVFQNAQEGIIICDSRSRIVDVNRAFTQITGYSREEAIGRDPFMLRAGQEAVDPYRDLWATVRRTGQWRGELVNRRKDGTLCTESLSVTAVYDAEGNVENYIGIFSDITTHKETQARLERMAYFDALTQLPNRVLITDRLRQAIRQCDRDGKMLAVCYLDLDGFKEINEADGNSCGDALLISVASRLAGNLRTSDSIGRLGGDEFAVILGDLDDQAQGETALRRVLDLFAEPFEVPGRAVAITITASVGVSYYPTDGDDPDVLLRQAGQAMFSAKQAGRNRYAAFDPERDRQARTLHETLSRIDAALRAGEFRLHYQPKVDMLRGTVVGAEALIRWQHPDRGLLAPGTFLPMVEETPLAVSIGDWVLEEALRQMEEWSRDGLNLPVSVNVSARQLQEDNFPERLGALLDRYPTVPANRLELEILETSALEDMAQVCAIIERCRQFGVEFALDDFGTGYCSLAYLKRLPASTLKIDQSFVRGMLDDADDFALVSAIIGLTKAFDRTVVAEGVETPETGAALLRLGCHVAQGYGVARPMAADLIPAWVHGFKVPDVWRQ